MKDELDEDEYNTTRKETIDQLSEFQQSLQNMTSGNLSLINDINAAQLAVQAAIRNSASPQILNMFLKKENGALRSKLKDLEQDLRLNRISKIDYDRNAAEILKMLDKLGEPLAPAEQDLLRKVRIEESDFAIFSLPH